MKWITEHNIEILDINCKTKTCRVNYNGRLCGCPMRKHKNNWYFSVDDRCVWYLAKDVRMSLCYSCEEGENLGDWDYEDWVCCRCHRDERLPDTEDCEFYKKMQLPSTVKTRAIVEVIDELESRKDYGTEYAQAMEDAIVILKAMLGIDDDLIGCPNCGADMRKEAENETN